MNYYVIAKHCVICEQSENSMTFRFKLKNFDSVLTPLRRLFSDSLSQAYKTIETFEKNQLRNVNF